MLKWISTKIPNRFCLRSDHHHLILERCDTLHATEVIGEAHFEMLDEVVLFAWLKKFPQLKKAHLTLILGDETCQWFEQSKSEWHGDFSAILEDAEFFYCRALDAGGTWKIAALEQASVEAYLTVAKQLQLQTLDVIPTAYPAMHFLPERSYQTKQAYYKKLFILGLPIFVLLLCWGLVHIKTAELKQIKKHNRALHNSLVKLQNAQSGRHLVEVVPITKQLFAVYDNLETLQFLKNNEVELSGYAQNMEDLNALLNHLALMPGVKTKSLQDLQMQSQNQGMQSWKIHFQLEAQS